jgi:hypothetical protein
MHPSCRGSNGAHQVQALVALGCGGCAMPDSGDRGELLASFASRTLGCRNRAIALATPVNDRNLSLAAAMHRVAMLAYRHAESGQRTYREIAKGNSANQRGEPPVLAWWQEKAIRRSGGSRTPASEIAGHLGRIGVADRLEKAINVLLRIPVGFNDARLRRRDRKSFHEDADNLGIGCAAVRSLSAIASKPEGDK